MSRPNPIKPIFHREKIKAAVHVAREPPTATLTWTWPGLVSVPSTTDWPDQFIASDSGVLAELRAELGIIEPPVDVGGEVYAYNITLMVGIFPAGTVSIASNQTIAATSVFNGIGLTPSVGIHPQIAPLPWGGVYDLTITVTYSYG